MRCGGAWVWAVCCSVLACGAKTGLEEAEIGDPVTEGAGAGTAGAGAPPSPRQEPPAPTGKCETACVLSLFSERPGGCGPCHNRSLQTAGLDLASPGVTVRVADVPARHREVPEGASCPVGDKLLDTGDPSASWLLAKIRGQAGTCGVAMPVNAPVSLEDRKCLEAFVICVALGR
jgi:hypothetical protein